MKYIFSVLLLSCVISAKAQLSACLSADEKRLYDLIMEYRSEKGLRSIPLSLSLTYVAQVHAKDLHENRPDQGDCNMHSWSPKGKWTACCYTADHKQAQCMWNKPKELTSYPGYGYEISSGSTADMTPEAALNLWKNSTGHNNVIINGAMWRKEWNAIGIGVYGHYAVVWFGHETDPAGKVNECR